MMDAAFAFGFAAVLAAMLLNVVRLARGPAMPDRILALDTLYIDTIALLTLIGIRTSSVVYFVAALLIAMMGFVGTVALSKFVSRGSVIE